MSALALRFALRELRGGLARLLRVHRLHRARRHGDRRRRLGGREPRRRARAAQGRVILGGDLAFSLMQREASATEQRVSRRRTVASRWRRRCAPWRGPDDGRTALVEIKAVDGAYPLFGSGRARIRPCALADAACASATASSAPPPIRRCSRGSISSPAHRITIGNATIELRAVLTSEPDKLAGGIGFGPRLLISEAALRATGLLQPGSLVRWHYRLRLPDRDASDGAVRVGRAGGAERLAPMPAGTSARAPTPRRSSSATSSASRNSSPWSALTALLVGGVGVANAVRAISTRKRDVIATLKALGATGGRVFAIYLHADRCCSRCSAPLHRARCSARRCRS